METFKDDCEYCDKAPKPAVYMLRDAKDGWVGAVSCEKHLQTAKEHCQGNFPKATFKVLPWKEWKAHVWRDSTRLLDIGGANDDPDDDEESKTLREWRTIYRRRWRDLPAELRKKEGSFQPWFKRLAEEELSITGEGEDWRLVRRPRKRKT